MTKLTGEQIAAEKLDGWAYLIDGLQTRIATPDFATGLALVNAVGAVAEELGHHPDVDLRYTHVRIRVTSHDTGGVTARDVRLARRVDELAAAAGLTTDRSGVARLELGLDTPAAGGVAGFWAGVLGAEVTTAGGDPEVWDGDDALPRIWFQRSGSEEPRQRWHPDLWVDPGRVQPLIAAALDADGALVDESAAPRFWVLADPEGNKVCLCTWAERG